MTPLGLLVGNGSGEDGQCLQGLENLTRKRKPMGGSGYQLGERSVSLVSASLMLLVGHENP